MPGLYGAEPAGHSPEELAATVMRANALPSTTVSHEPALGVVHHGDRDPHGYQTVVGADAAGVLYGVLLDQSFSLDLVRSILDSPGPTLRSLDGPFSLACVDRRHDRLVLATDKLGTRQLYYSREAPVTFGSEVKTALAGVDRPTIDPRSVADLLMMLHVWGTKTLVNQVAAVPAASYVEIADGTAEVTPYWQFSFSERDSAGYPERAASLYTEVVGDVLDTIEGTPGLWLSGGLDSRMLGSAIRRNERALTAYTYDRPTDLRFDPFRSDTSIAKAVADRFGADHRTVSLSPSRLAATLPHLVRATDGLVGWSSLSNLAAVLHLEDPPGVMLEGPVPLLTGEKVEARHLGRDAHPATTLESMHARTPIGLVDGLLRVDYDPRQTFVDAAANYPGSSHDETVLGVTHEHYNRGKHFTGNKVARTRIGTRETLPAGALLDHLGGMPPELRRQSLPLTSVPHVPSPMKLRTYRAIDVGTASIPYAMTRLPPSMPYALHGLAFAAKTALGRLVSDSVLAEWLRTDNDLSRHVDALLDAAADRPIFYRESIAKIRDAHRDGADHLLPIAAISTVELFHRHVLEEAESEVSTDEPVGRIDPELTAFH